MAPPSRGAHSSAQLPFVICLLVLILELGVQALKQGSCPIIPKNNENCAQRCLQDEACAADYKCCSNGCGRECLKPVDNSRKRHYKNKQQAGSHRRGTCPSNMMTSQPCGQPCTNDHDCRGDYKCCPTTSCGNECVYPIPPFAVSEPHTSTGWTAGPKAGSCPPEEQLANTCDKHCSDDEPCPEHLMCCNTNCGMQCVEPADDSSVWHSGIGIRPGNCPKPTPDGVCEEECTSDLACPENQKCCFNGCGFNCMRIMLSIQEPQCPEQCEGQCEDECQTDYDCDPGVLCFFKECRRECLGSVPGRPLGGENTHHLIQEKGVCQDHKCDPGTRCEVELTQCDEDPLCPLEPICIYLGESCRHYRCAEGTHCVWRQPCPDGTCRHRQECVQNIDIPGVGGSTNDSVRLFYRPHATLLALFLILL